MNRISLRIVDGCLAALLLVAPLCLGGRHPAGKFVFVSLIGAASVAWMVHLCTDRDRCRRRTPGFWLLVAGGLLVGVQFFPLPGDWPARLSPSLSSLLPLWAADVTATGPWETLSLTPGRTRLGLVLFIALAMLFVLLVQRIDRRQEVERMLRLMGLAAIGMAVLGLLQYLVSNDKFLWFYEDPYRVTSDAVKGPFTNENHFAHFLALGIGPLLWWLHHVFRTKAPRGFSAKRPTADDTGESAQFWLPFGLVAVVLAALLTYSRGGVLILAVSAMTCLVLAATRSLGNGKLWVSVGTVVGIVAVALGIHGYRPLADQLATLKLTGVSDLSRALGREEIWTADWKAIRDFPLVGTGVGSHSEVAPVYLERATGKDYTHAESGYLHVLVETGWLGGGLLLIGIGLCGSWCWRGLRQATSREEAACLVAVIGPLVASLVHSIWDFVWFIPACLTATIFLAACACRMCVIVCGDLSEANDPVDLDRKPRLLPHAVASAAVGVAAVAMSYTLVGPAVAGVHWDRYLHAGPEAGVADRAVAESSAADVQQRVRHLRETLRWQPDHSRAHARMATLLLRRFDLEQQTAANAMPLSAIRDASASFSSPDELRAWLDTAVGENLDLLEQALDHARRSVAACPLHGEAYIAWSEVNFLNDPHPSMRTALIEQAVQVRPHNGTVLLAAGSAAIEAGRIEQGFRYWGAAFECAPELQAPLFEALRAHVPADFLLEQLQLELPVLRRLFAHYQQADDPDVARTVGLHLASRLESAASDADGQIAANLWHEAHGVHYDLGDIERAAACGARAVANSPNEVAVRRAYAMRLTQLGRHADALAELRICLEQAPGDAQLAGLIAEVEQREQAATREPALRHTSTDNNAYR